MTSKGNECNGETHTTCDSRLKKNGNKAYCCFCVPHKNCDFTAPKEDGGGNGKEQYRRCFHPAHNKCGGAKVGIQKDEKIVEATPNSTEWAVKFDERFVLGGNWLAISPNEIKHFITGTLAAQKQSILTLIEGMMWSHEGEVGAAPTYRKMHNDILREVIAGIQKSLTSKIKEDI